MAARKAFPLRLAPDLYDEIRRWADSEFRSVNSQIEYILRRAVLQRRRAGSPGEAITLGESGSTEIRDRPETSNRTTIDDPND